MINPIHAPPPAPKSPPDEWGVNQLNWLSQIAFEIFTKKNKKLMWLSEATHINFPIHVWWWDIPVSYASFPDVRDDEGLSGFFTC